jgi:hypothetical protein
MSPTRSSSPTRERPAGQGAHGQPPAHRRRRHGRASGRRAGQQHASQLRMVAAGVRSGCQTQGGRYPPHPGGQAESTRGHHGRPDPTGSRQDQRGGPECRPGNPSVGRQILGGGARSAPQQPVISPAKQIRPDRCGAATLRLVAATASIASKQREYRFAGRCHPAAASLPARVTALGRSPGAVTRTRLRWNQPGLRADGQTQGGAGGALDHGRRW